MRSNYKRIGDLVKQIKLKNQDSEYDQLLGINIDKFFMPSVANIVGTDLSKYKVVSKYQFACNRMHVGRDGRIPIALSLNEIPFLVSPAYTVFEIIDSGVLPEYMMMWFRRPEFDRECCFHTDADVRGGLPWDLFCDIELPIPPIEKQRKIVAEYNTVVNRIKLNEQLNQKLEETAQALYKHWFVDFEFPISAEQAASMGQPNLEGKPYKSSGGKMVFNDELDKEIPIEWSVDPLKEFGKVITGKTPSIKYPEHFGDELPFITPTDFSRYFKFSIAALRLLSKDGSNALENKILPANSLMVSCIGSDMGKVVVNSVPSITNQQINSIVPLEEHMIEFLYNYFKDIYEHLRNIATGSSTMLMINKTEFELIEILRPPSELCRSFYIAMKPLNILILNNGKENILLEDLRQLVLAKMTQVEPEKETA